MNSVNVAAPGSSVYTTYIGGSYAYFSGTSAAAPMVAGVAALVKSKYPNLSTLGVRAAVVRNVDTLSSLNGKVKSGGRVNECKALTNVTNRTYTVVYNKNDGSGSNMSNTTVTYGMETTLRNNTYTKTGYIFNGWIPKECPIVNGCITTVLLRLGILKVNNRAVIQNIITEIRLQLLKHLQ